MTRDVIPKWLPGVAALAVGAVGFVLGRHVPEMIRVAPWYQSLFVSRWPWYVAGAALAAIVLVMWRLERQLLGVSTGCEDVCRWLTRTHSAVSWRMEFLVGIVVGGAVAGGLAGHVPGLALGVFDQFTGGGTAIKVPVLVLAGAMVGAGARAAGGCTSGHGIVGMALGGKASWLATIGFMAAGFAATHAMTVIWGLSP